MTRLITKDTVLCMSLASRPSNIGTRFHNYLYAELGLDYVYKAFTTTDLAAAIGGIRALGIRGCGREVPVTDTFAVTGSGGMAKAVVAALRDAGFRSGTVIARNERTGRAMVDQYGYGWSPELGDRRPQLLINATPVGMAGGPAAGETPFSAQIVAAAATVFIMRQAMEHLVLYTGVRPIAEQAQRAAEFSTA